MCNHSIIFFFLFLYYYFIFVHFLFDYYFSSSAENIEHSMCMCDALQQYNTIDRIDSCCFENIDSFWNEPLFWLFNVRECSQWHKMESIKWLSLSLSLSFSHTYYIKHSNKTIDNKTHNGTSILNENVL